MLEKNQKQIIQMGLSSSASEQSIQIRKVINITVEYSVLEFRLASKMHLNSSEHT